MSAAGSPLITRLDAAAYRILTDAPKADGTYEWNATTMVLVHAHAGGPGRDVERVRAARRALDPQTELFVDANGALGAKQALQFAQAFRDEGVTWFEEPVSSDDLAGLRLVRDRAPAGSGRELHGRSLPFPSRFRRGAAPAHRTGPPNPLVP